MSDAATINGWLAGSPYSFPKDLEGESTASALLTEQVRIVRRHMALQHKFEATTSAIRAELERDFDVRLVYESNAIEGVQASFPETRELLNALDQRTSLSAATFRQQVVEDKKLVEVIGHGRALQFVHELASSLQDRRLREVDLRNIHRLAMAHEPRIAGHYKTTDNEIAGRKDFLTARSDDVGHHMRLLIEWLNGAQIHGPLLATVVHAWLADIHPFEDGNGRVARLLANYVLYRSRWPCLIVRSGPEREEYYEALKHSDAGGDIAPLFGLFVKGLNRSLSELDDPSFARSIIEADLWQSDDFEAWAGLHQTFTARLQQALAQRGLTLDVIGWLGPADFLYLKRRNRSGNGWFAKVRGSDRDLDLLLWFGFQSEILVSSAGGQLVAGPSIFISERDRAAIAMHPYRPLWADKRLTVHELTLQAVAGQDRLLLRQHGNVSAFSIDSGVGALATALRDMVDTDGFSGN